jgi:hypothetical protein
LSAKPFTLGLSASGGTTAKSLPEPLSACGGIVHYLSAKKFHPQKRDGISFNMRTSNRDYSLLALKSGLAPGKQLRIKTNPNDKF